MMFATKENCEEIKRLDTQPCLASRALDNFILQACISMPVMHIQNHAEGQKILEVFTSCELGTRSMSEAMTVNAVKQMIM
jgi:meiotically up-regulated gene 157 (Mug157) protein